MSGPPSKRRKMRPNNPIAVEKAKTLNDAMQGMTTNKHLTAEKSTSEKNDAKKVEKDKATSKKKNKEKDVSSAKESKTNDSLAKHKEEPVTPKLSTPTPTPYTSASDSDETDDERRTRYAKKSTASSAKKTTPLPSNPQLSGSDSDETDNEKPKPKSAKSAPKPAPVKKKATSTPAPLSDSDSDETDNESRKLSQKKPVKKQQKQKQQELSASDSDDTEVEVRKTSQSKKVKQKPVSKTLATIENSDTDSSEDEDTPQPEQQQSDSNSDSDAPKKPASKKIRKSNLVSNRISFRKKKEYDDKLSAANNVKGRLSDLFVPEVKQDYFISDSESDTDSGEDYDAREYPSWQRTLSSKHNTEKDPWPKLRKFGYSDKLKLEKRIKKICRREGMPFEQAQYIFSSSERSPHIRFFQKIAKAFPDVSLHRLAKICKEMYHEKRNYGPWTEAEIKHLEELIKIHGRNPTLISQFINRSPKNINDYLYNHSGTEKKITKRWSKAEDEMLAKAVAKYKKDDARMSFAAIEPLFNGTRTQKQIHARYYNMRHLIQPDGTLVEERKATPYEELKYLKSLLNQVREHRLAEESQVDYAKNRGFVDKKFYLKARANIKGFEGMSIKDILKKLIEKQNLIIQTRREENLLGSDPDADED